MVGFVCCGDSGDGEVRDLVGKEEEGKGETRVVQDWRDDVDELEDDVEERR